MFYVQYDDKRNQYVGLCRVYPLYAHYADDIEEAMQGIMDLVYGLDHDNETTDVEANPHADTDRIEITIERAGVIVDVGWSDMPDTDVFWPPPPLEPKK